MAQGQSTLSVSALTRLQTDIQRLSLLAADEARPARDIRLSPVTVNPLHSRPSVPLPQSEYQGNQESLSDQHVSLYDDDAPI